MCRNGLDFERASGRVEWSGVKWNGQSVSQSVVKCPPKQSEAFFPMYKKEKENKQRKNIYILLYIPHVLPTLLYKKFSIINNMIP